MEIQIELTTEQRKQSDELCNKIIDVIKDNIDLEDKINQALTVYTLWILLNTLQEGANIKLSDVRLINEK